MRKGTVSENRPRIRDSETTKANKKELVFQTFYFRKDSFKETHKTSGIKLLSHNFTEWIVIQE